MRLTQLIERHLIQHILRLSLRKHQNHGILVNVVISICEK